METRTITEVKIYVLVLNLMRDRTESGTPLVYSYDKQKLINYYKGELAETPYKESGSSGFSQGDTIYHKTFKKGSMLEWFNPCYDDFSLNRNGHGIQEVWVKEEHLQNIILLFI